MLLYELPILRFQQSFKAMSLSAAEFQSEYVNILTRARWSPCQKLTLGTQSHMELHYEFVSG